MDFWHDWSQCYSIILSYTGECYKKLRQTLSIVRVTRRLLIFQECLFLFPHQFTGSRGRIQQMIRRRLLRPVHAVRSCSPHRMCNIHFEAHGTQRGLFSSPIHAVAADACAVGVCGAWVAILWLRCFLFPPEERRVRCVHADLLAERSKLNLWSITSSGSLSHSLDPQTL